MNNAFDDFLTAMYAQTNCKPQLASEKLGLYLLERVRYIDDGHAFTINVIVREIGNGQMRVGVLGFSDMNTGKNYLVTRGVIPEAPSTSRPKCVAPDGSLIFVGIDFPVKGVVAYTVLKQLAAELAKLIDAHNEYSAQQQEIEAQNELDAAAIHTAYISDVASRTACPAERVQEIYAIVAGVASDEKVKSLVTNLAAREGQLLAGIQRISNDLNAVALDIWSQTSAGHLSRKTEQLANDLQSLIK
jgi:hypothetical protein